jgi:large subunit ribosomal protein L14e
MMSVGRVCVKTAGRDAGKKCVVVEILEGNYVMIDGETRRRKCNIKHLEPLIKHVDIGDGASHDDVVSVFKDMGIEIAEKKPRPKTERPKKVRKVKEKIIDEKSAKKEKKKKEVKEKSAPKKPEVKAEVKKEDKKPKVKK